MSSKQEAARRELEWRKCEENPFYFMSHYWRIAVVDKGPIPLDFWEPQKKVLNRYVSDNKHTITLKGRQLGITTVSMGFAFWDAYFHQYHPWTVVSTSQPWAGKNLNMAKIGYARLPSWMRGRGPDIINDTQELLAFSNGSRIESIPSTSSSGRGDAVYGVIMDEAAHQEQPDEVFAALDPMCYGKYIVLSSANGYGNWFADTWADAQKEGTVWTPLFLSWKERPDRDDEWYEEQERKFRGTIWMLHQEHPRDPDEAFAKSGHTAFGYDLLQELNWEDPKKYYVWDSGQQDFVPVPKGQHPDNFPLVLGVWEEPNVEKDKEGFTLRKPNYVIACDPSLGLIHGDATGITVYDANNLRCVARIRTFYPVEEIPEILAKLGYRYHTALIIVERNNMGYGVNSILFQYLRYPRLYRMPHVGRIPKGDRTVNLGFHTTAQSKAKMISDMLRAMREEEGARIEIRDPLFREEALTFISDGRGGYAAQSGNHDDMILSHLIALQGCLDIGRFPVLWRDHGPQKATFDEVFDLSFTKEINPLDQPLGSKPQVSMRKSWWQFE